MNRCWRTASAGGTAPGPANQDSSPAERVHGNRLHVTHRLIPEEATSLRHPAKR